MSDKESGKETQPIGLKLVLSANTYEVGQGLN